MSDESVTDDAEPHPETGILRQIDLYFGRKHRFYYLVVGLVTGVLVFWGAQTQIFDPSSRAAFQGMVDRIDIELRQVTTDLKVCESANRILRDSMDQINSYGIHLGTFELVARKDEKMVGGMLTVELSQGKLYIEVDSTKGAGDDDTEWFYAPIGEGVVNPIFHGSLRLNLICSEVTDSTVTIDVYERK